MRASSIVLSAALAGLGVYTVHLKVENQRLRDQASLDGRYELEDEEPWDELVAAEAAAEKVEAQSGFSPPNARPESVAYGDETAPASPPMQGRGRGGADRYRRMALAFADPDLRVDMVERQMNQIDERYADFFRDLPLSPDHLDTLRALMAERRVTGWEARMRLSASETAEERMAVDSDRRRQNALIAEQMADLLGAEGMARLEAFTESVPYRERAKELAVGLSYSSFPLTDEQSDGLARAMQSAAAELAFTKDLSDLRRAGNASPEDLEAFFAERAERDALALAAAAELLSREQIGALAERQAADRERDERQWRFHMQNRSGGRPREP